MRPIDPTQTLQGFLNRDKNLLYMSNAVVLRFESSQQKNLYTNTGRPRSGQTIYSIQTERQRRYEIIRKKLSLSFGRHALN